MYIMLILYYNIFIYIFFKIFKIRQKYNPLENRTLNLLSYFSKVSNGPNEIHSISSLRKGWWNIREAFSDRIPYQVFWKDVRIQILYADVPNSQILYALNGSVVGLISDTTQYNSIGSNLFNNNSNNSSNNNNNIVNSNTNKSKTSEKVMSTLFLINNQ